VPTDLSHHEGFAERLRHRSEDRHRRVSNNPEVACVLAVEHMVIGSRAGIAISPTDRQKEHSLGLYRHQGHNLNNREIASASPLRARLEKMTAAGLRLIVWLSLTR
jgi:hypothetical protein